MPAKRKAHTSGGPATKGAQSTLSFGGTHKVTKPVPSASKEAKSKPLIESIAKKIESEVIIEVDQSSISSVGHVDSGKAVAEQAAVEKLELKRSEEEVRASKLSDRDIKRYWRARDEDRLAPRVHQEGLATEEKILRLFDMTSSYGPCIGIARMKRWVRANKLGLSPPIEVLAVLLKEEAKGNAGIERAYVDELMVSKALLGG